MIVDEVIMAGFRKEREVPGDHKSSDSKGDDALQESRRTFPLKFPGLKQFGIEIGSALGASAIVSPLVATIDAAIYKNASGTQTLFRSLASGAKEFMLSPVSYVRTTPVLIMIGVYGLTYTSANFVDGLSEVNHFDSLYPKMVTSSVFNIGACVFKDVLYTRMYGTLANTKVPKLSLALYFGRDIITLCATFGTPDLLASHLLERGVNPIFANIMPQIAVPCAVQLVTTPMHLLAINLYNRPKSTIKDRFKFLRSEYLDNTAVKSLRVFIAFGIGGLANKRLRDYGYSLLDGKS